LFASIGDGIRVR